MNEKLHEGPVLLVETLPDTVAELGPLGRELALEAGETAWQGSQAPHDVAVVLEGGIDILCECGEGEEVLLRQLLPGAVAVQPTEEVHRAPATLRARVASRLLLIPTERFRSFLREHPLLLEQLLWLQIERTRSVPCRMRRERVATDPLTGLYACGFFGERLAIELERARLTSETLTIAIFDVDHLRDYEAAHGREGSETILRRLGVLLRKTGRRSDIAARLADDELGMLLYGALPSDGWRFAESFRGVVMGTSFLPDADRPPRRVTISGGISSFPQDGDEEVALLVVARERIARAKEAGGNCTVGLTLRSR